MVEDFVAQVVEWLGSDRAAALGEAFLLLALGLLVAKIVSSGVLRLLLGRVTAQQSMVIRRLTFYSIAGLATVSALNAAGLDLGIFLGAAGILTVALGFASQTSASNLISGLFLLGERPFVVGDVVRAGTFTGEVTSIDWLSVKLRTFDNLFVRIPNETLLKTEITNLTRYPIRRIDLTVGVAYKEDLRTVYAILLEVADAHPHCLDEPRPQLFFNGYGESSLDLQLSVWVVRESFWDVKRELPIAINTAFRDAGVEIPFPHRSLYAGSTTEPFPVRVVSDDAPTSPD